MTSQRLIYSALALAATIGATGCICGTKERNVVISSPSGLTLTVDGELRTLRVPDTRLTEFHITSPAFDFLYRTLEGSTNGEGVAFGITGTDLVTNDVVVISLALPVSLRPGDEYTIGSTFNVEAALNQDIRSWGAHDLVQSNRADVGFTTAVYDFPPPTYTPNFRAASTSGTVRVVGRTSGRVELALNLVLTDADGRTKRITGNVAANTELVKVGCA